MHIVSYDKEIRRELQDIDKEFDDIKEDIKWYLSHRGKAAIRLKNYDNMMKMKEKVETNIENITTNSNGPILYIKVKEETNE